MKKVSILAQPEDDYSDVTVYLRDQTQTIALKLHKNILAWQIPYFETRFSFERRCGREDSTPIEVDDAEIAKDYILLFYGQEPSKEWSDRESLLKLKLDSYFGFDLGQDMLYQMNFTPEIFPLLLQVMKLPEMKLNRRLIRKFRNVIPAGFCLEDNDEQLARVVVNEKKFNSSLLTVDKRGSVKIWNLDDITQVQNKMGEVVGYRLQIIKIQETSSGWLLRRQHQFVFYGRLYENR